MNLNELRILLKQTDNQALVLIESTPEYKRFKKDVARALMRQVEYIVEAKNLEFILGMSKVDSGLLSQVRYVFTGVRLDELVDSIDSFLLKSGNIGGQVALEYLGINGAFNLKDQRLMQQLLQQKTFLVDSVDGTTIDWLAENLSKYYSEGLTHEQIAQKITERFSDISLSRAELIVHSEMANASSIVAEKTYINNGVQRWRWVTVGDSRVTPECRANEMAGYRMIGEPFPYGPNNRRTPRFPRCRCEMRADLTTKLPVAPWLGGS